MRKILIIIGMLMFLTASSTYGWVWYNLQQAKTRVETRRKIEDKSRGPLRSRPVVLPPIVEYDLWGRKRYYPNPTKLTTTYRNAPLGSYTKKREKAEANLEYIEAIESHLRIPLVITGCFGLALAFFCVYHRKNGNCFRETPKQFYTKY